MPPFLSNGELFEPSCCRALALGRPRADHWEHKWTVHRVKIQIDETESTVSLEMLLEAPGDLQQLHCQ